jgi:hypothetical protein
LAQDFRKINLYSIILLLWQEEWPFEALAKKGRGGLAYGTEVSPFHPPITTLANAKDNGNTLPLFDLRESYGKIDLNKN